MNSLSKDMSDKVLSITDDMSVNTIISFSSDYDMSNYFTVAHTTTILIHCLIVVRL